ncbi:RagB/SusD family nutrient uptake outer membrane protein [Paraflavitalea sp. CAU 1676]|uniref:RagB/SusD family nutrient uptake outer membrane protein n=1 Tax=Paraflavitalea sp. CAU 1676 TaxID=3032598 RepID=UPI0023DB6D92|nr:RagB/SusD family nutrient uptake outer membrane protein [Paraflavitalea sp. CAU 1676]MDF2189603.1 RagB/SusD family nutrient uptake outer membrane protein [Paraflavitalea sp. CAU 1676]
MDRLISILKIQCWILLIICVGCNKDAFLESNPKSELVIPSTLDDCQALLDNENVMSETPSLGEISADNYYLPYNFWRGLNIREKNAHIWQQNTFEGLVGNIPDWNSPYKQVFTANVILSALSKIPLTSSNSQKWNAIKGAALFARGHAFYQISQLFSPEYTSSNVGKNQGIPIKLSPDVDDPTVRSTLQETYNKILSDLSDASLLLPSDVPPMNRNRSSRPAALALLSRVSLFMNRYQDAKKYADTCLSLYSTLINYDTIKTAGNNPFNSLNAETIYQSRFITTNVLRAITVSNCIVDSSLYYSYEPNDLRKDVLFRKHPTTNAVNPKASYNGTNQLFTGIATDEVYLIRAECQARLGNTQEAMSDLNNLLNKRWKAGEFVSKTAESPSAALDTILKERRKELPFRGLRWSDIRRLNKNGDEKIVLKRFINGVSFKLEPGDPRFTLLIPPDVIGFTGIQQNPR